MKSNIEYRGLNNYTKSNKGFNNRTITNIIISILVGLLFILAFNSFKKGIIGEKNKSINLSELHNELNLEGDKIEFINKVAKGAVETYKKYKILPSITIGQAILESAWGESDLATNYNNLFGIKADSRWDGAVATIVTSENYNDITKANFRYYKDIEESIKDYGEFLYENIRYRDNGLFDGKDYIEQAQALENAGYSTAKDEKGEPIYADKLIGVIEKYNLMIYDDKMEK